MLCHSNSRRGLTKLMNRCASVSTHKKRTSKENGRKKTKKAAKEDEESAYEISFERGKIMVKEVLESADDAFAWIGKNYHERVRDKDDEIVDSDEWWNVWFWFSLTSLLSFSCHLIFIHSVNCRH